MMAARGSEEAAETAPASPISTVPSLSSRSGNGAHALRRRVNLAIVAALSILALTDTVVIWTTVRSRDAGQQRRRSAVRRVELAALLSSILDAETGQRGYLLTAKPEFLEPYHRAVDSLPIQLRRVAASVAGEPGQAGRLSALQPLVRQKLALLTETIRLAESQHQPAALAIVQSGRGKRIMDEIRVGMAAMEKADDSLVARGEANFWAVERLSLIASAAGGTLAVLFLLLAGRRINRDFNRRVEIEASLRESERRLAEIIEHVPNIVYLKEPQGLRFVHFNKAGEDILGYSRADVLGKPARELFPAELARRFEAEDREILAGGMVEIPEESVQSRTHGIRILQSKKVVIRDEFGRPLYILGVSEDITDRKNAETAIREAKEAAEAANHAKSDFLAKMSHELRTPLNSIIGFSEILEDETFGPLNDKQRRHVANVLASGRNLLQLINDILDLSKVEAGRMELVPVEFDLVAALEQDRAIIAPLADKKNLTLHLVVEPQRPRITADQGKLRQIMYNLLSNAIKFTPEGGRVDIMVRPAGSVDGDTRTDWMEVAVTDTGIGIGVEDQERIFREFEQVEHHQAVTQQGTGLGLALTKKLVELHGGRIWVESQPGKGSTFRFTLPARWTPLAAEPDSGDSCSASSRAEGPLVLVIDDDPRARQLFGCHLIEAGYRVAMAATGGEAIAQARDLKPDAIILDILLPGSDGFLILTQLKSMPESRKIPVVVASVTDRRELGFTLGAADWLVKPVSRPRLLGALERVMGDTLPGGQKNVLVVDDEPATVEYLSEVLTQQGFRVLTANGGRAGIELALAKRPDVIILDLVMPEVNGFDVVHVLRADPAGRAIPILILTAKELSGAEQQRLRSTAQAIVAKGGKEALLSELARVCRLTEVRG